MERMKERVKECVREQKWESGIYLKCKACKCFVFVEGEGTVDEMNVHCETAHGGKEAVQAGDGRGSFTRTQGGNLKTPSRTAGSKTQSLDLGGSGMVKNYTFPPRGGSGGGAGEAGGGI